MSLAHRHRQPELMDDPSLDRAEHRRALAGLARINAASGSAAMLWRTLRRVCNELKQPLKVLDIATGSGDILLALHQRARQENLPMTFAGCDLSPLAIEVAKESAGEIGVDFFTYDALKDSLPSGFDVFTCSLFLHHLDESDVVALLKNLRDANPKLILVNDLERSRFNYGVVWVASRLFSRSHVVHVDGPLSIRGSFTIGEMKALATAAGLTGVTVRSKFPCRMLLEWRGPM